MGFPGFSSPGQSGLQDLANCSEGGGCGARLLHLSDLTGEVSLCSGQWLMKTHNWSRIEKKCQCSVQLQIFKDHSRRRGGKIPGAREMTGRFMNSQNHSCDCMHRIKPDSIPAGHREGLMSPATEGGTIDSWWLLRAEESVFLRM
ncbi:uncharacterized protein LOC110311189 [Mus caroli]|uniref:Uncharacterized protein LOC110311189 n=1 Tax=Mus caroli TaxID=10089 RepID=A0A6P5QZ36_MUSCR|nr:uncharacterized protein LOC110311189 [Mus caroli]